MKITTTKNKQRIRRTSTYFLRIQYVLSGIGLFLGGCLQAQDLDFEAMSQATDLKINGAVTANSVFYNSNQRSSREPFTYYLQGNINLSWLTFSMPISYSLTNQGNELNYQVPYKFNRLSIHPKWKWITAHIGDASMSFSPYTLDGHQFTGAGLELTPEGPLNISVMGGQLLKAVKPDEFQPQTLPTFRRMGYGVKTSWEKEIYKIQFSGFYGRDEKNSLPYIPDDRGVTPKENLALSLGGELAITKDIKLSAEYGSSAITRDTRDASSSYRRGLSGLFIGNPKNSTQYYSAYKAGLEFRVEKMQWGVGYERVDPGYETLGAYYFTNDFENITVHGSRPFLNDRLNIAFNLGYQRDNLENTKEQNTRRIVGAVNASLQLSEKLNFTGSYSNFTTYTNQRLNQFDQINHYYDPEQEYLQTFRYEQLSQNANINANWNISAKDKLSQNFNFNYSLAASANKTDGVIRRGQASNFHNFSTAYNLTFPQKNLSISTLLNYTYVDITDNDSRSWGPSVTLNKKLLNQTLNTNIGVSYNTSESKQANSQIINLRGGATYTLFKKHNFNLTGIYLIKSGGTTADLNELTVTFGYGYSFDLGSPKGKPNNN
ncbi:hypothetical protein ETU09_09970 [Apibacter muscae]|uniref:Outer membrane protein beta-barrel domain-containing protein n=1 Tax=Apibacter muscae TaxID=2509004 RepID=A0A563DAB7_9FLAO|nr:hypothetical protein [Apibacter muscae]TWP26871.1 hypothetical protein ETU09_09970 [Apibacter muscae]